MIHIKHLAQTEFRMSEPADANRHADISRGLYVDPRAG